MIVEFRPRLVGDEVYHARGGNQVFRFYTVQFTITSGLNR